MKPLEWEPSSLTHKQAAIAYALRSKEGVAAVDVEDANAAALCEALEKSSSEALDRRDPMKATVGTQESAEFLGPRQLKIHDAMRAGVKVSPTAIEIANAEALSIAIAQSLELPKIAE
jgi:hypothetical protein